MRRKSLAGVLGLAVLLVAAPASATESQVVVGDAADSWYASPPAVSCSVPVGCAPALPTTPFPAGTLHVGVVSGQESARAYVKPDLSVLPFDASLKEGLLVLPLSTDSRAGQVQPDTARLRACLVSKPITDGVEGGTSAAPTINCELAQSAAAQSTDRSSFLVDLAPFLQAWNAGTPQLGLALVPAATQETGATWHVSFDGKRSAAVAKVSSTLTYDVPDPTPAGTTPGPAPSTPTAVGPGLPPLGGIAQPTPSLTPEPVLPTPAAPVTAPPAQHVAAPAAITTAAWYRNGAAVYMPLLLLCGIGLLVRAVARPVAPAHLETP